MMLAGVIRWRWPSQSLYRCSRRLTYNALIAILGRGGETQQKPQIPPFNRKIRPTVLILDLGRRGTGVVPWISLVWFLYRWSFCDHPFSPPTAPMGSSFWLPGGGLQSNQ